jgi:hypothetical protein
MTTYQYSTTFHAGSTSGEQLPYPYTAPWRLDLPKPTLARAAKWVVAVLMVLTVTLAAVDLTMGYTFDGSHGASRPVPGAGLGL